MFNIFLISPFKHFYLLTSFGVGVVGPGGSFMLGKHWASETYPQSKGFERHTSYLSFAYGQLDLTQSSLGQGNSQEADGA